MSKENQQSLAQGMTYMMKYIAQAFRNESNICSFPPYQKVQRKEE